MCDKTQFQELRKDLSSDTISETGKRVIDIIKRSAALYRCPKGQTLMVDTLKRLVSQKDQDDEVVYETLAKTFHDVVAKSEEHKTMMAAARRVKITNTGGATNESRKSVTALASWISSSKISTWVVLRVRGVRMCT